MFNKIKKNLIHFCTNGNITEDFVASRRKKVRKLRRVIRACFYVHCVAALLCFVISFAFGTDKATIIITPIALVLAWISFFAAGKNMPVKVVLFTLDFLFGIAMITWGALHSPAAVFTWCGVIMLVAGAFGIAAYIAALCKRFLNEFQPRNLRRADYTLLSNPNPEKPIDEESQTPVSLPPLTSDMRVLAEKLKEIICDDK